ncbi:hypothetical protein ACOMHN_052981 [Nucella lapillus]
MGGQPSDAPALSPPSPLQQGGQSSNAPALSPPSPLPQGGQPIALALSPPSPPPQGGQPSDAPGLSPSSSTLLLCPSDSTLNICHLNSQSAVKTDNILSDVINTKVDTSPDDTTTEVDTSPDVTTSKVTQSSEFITTKVSTSSDVTNVKVDNKSSDDTTAKVNPSSDVTDVKVNASSDVTTTKLNPSPDVTTTKVNTPSGNVAATHVTAARFSPEQRRCACIKILKGSAHKTAEEKRLMEEKGRELAQEIKENLTIPVANVSATRRRHISAQDDRSSSRFTAMVMAVICFLPLMAIVLVDCLRFLVFLKRKKAGRLTVP